MRVLNLLLCASAALASPASAQDAKRLTPITGVWDHIEKFSEDELLVAYAADYNPNTYRPTLLRGAIDGVGAVNKDRLHVGRAHYSNPANEMRNGTSKLTLAFNRIWITAPGNAYYFNIPIDEFHYLEQNILARRIDRQKEEAAWEGWHYYTHTLFFRPRPGMNWCDAEPLPNATSFPSGMKLDPYSQQSLYMRTVANYDLIPLAADSATLVWLYDGQLCVQDFNIGKARGASKYQEGPTPRPGAVMWSAKAPFDGGFWAYEMGDVYYLFAHTGKLYTATKKGKDELDIRAVWDEKDRPLTGAIQDAVTGNVFVFGTEGDAKKGSRFTFKLATKPETAWYRTEAKADDGFREAEDCVRAVKKHLKPNVVPAPAPRLKMR